MPARACPPEDCGGIWGYPMVFQVLAHPDGSELAEFANWVGPDFAPEEFDHSRINRQLTRAFPQGLPQRSNPISQMPWP